MKKIALLIIFAFSFNILAPVKSKAVEPATAAIVLGLLAIVDITNKEMHKSNIELRRVNDELNGRIRVLEEQNKLLKINNEKLDQTIQQLLRQNANQKEELEVIKKILHKLLESPNV